MKSKQLSIISKRPNPLDFTLFIDRQIDGDDLAKLLSDAGFKVERHKDNFEPEEDDDLWIDGAAERADKNIERDYLDIICERSAKLVIFTDNNSGYAQWGASLITAQESLCATLAQSSGPLIIRLGKRGNISKVRFPDEVEARRVGIETKRIVRAKRG